MDMEAKKAMVRRIRASIAPSEVFCTRILKTARGSVLVGLTADLSACRTVEEAEIATLILGERVDQLAIDRALAGSIITEKERGYAQQLTRNNYGLLVKERLDKLPTTVAQKAKTNGEAVARQAEG